MYLELTRQKVLILLYALECYMEELNRRERQTDYLFTGYAEERRKQRMEENRVLLLARMQAVDDLRSLLLDLVFETENQHFNE